MDKAKGNLNKAELKLEKANNSFERKKLRNKLSAEQEIKERSKLMKLETKVSELKLKVNKQELEVKKAELN